MFWGGVAVRPDAYVTVIARAYRLTDRFKGRSRYQAAERTYTQEGPISKQLKLKHQSVPSLAHTHMAASMYAPGPTTAGVRQGWA